MMHVYILGFGEAVSFPAQLHPTPTGAEVWLAGLIENTCEGVRGHEAESERRADVFPSFPSETLWIYLDIAYFMLKESLGILDCVSTRH